MKKKDETFLIQITGLKKDLTPKQRDELAKAFSAEIERILAVHVPQLATTISVCDVQTPPKRPKGRK